MVHLPPRSEGSEELNVGKRAGGHFWASVFFFLHSFQTKCVCVLFLFDVFFFVGFAVILTKFVEQVVVWLFDVVFLCFFYGCENRLTGKEISCRNCWDS